MRRKLKIFAGIAIVLLVLVGGWFVMNHLEDKLTTEVEVDEEEQVYGEDEDEEFRVMFLGDTVYETSDDLITYLILGTDNSLDDDKSQTGLADFLMLAVINKTQGTFGVMPIDRNTMVYTTMVDKNDEITGSSFQQICLANYYGADGKIRCKNTVNTVSQFLGFIDIDGYYSLDMDDIGMLNHLVGGVEVTLEDDLSMDDPAMKKGATLVLNDEQANYFLRARMEVGEGENAERMARQQVYLKAFADKALSIIKEKPAEANSFYEKLQKNAVTNISASDYSKALEAVRGGTNLGILSIDGTSKMEVSKTDNLEHEQFFANETSIINNLSTLMNMHEVEDDWEDDDDWATDDEDDETESETEFE